MRVRGFAEYRPQARNGVLVENVQIVLNDMQGFLPLTLRQVFYRLVVKQQIDKTEKGYARLCEVCNRARRAEMIAFDDIRDDGPTIRYGHDFRDANDLGRHLVDTKSSARLDLQSHQDRRVWLWCEAAGMVPQLTKVAHKYGVSVISSGGFDSLTMKYEMAQQLDSDSVVLHLGDYDPSGVHIFSSLAEDINALHKGPDLVGDVFGIPLVSLFGDDIEFVRLAVTPEQRDQLCLPTAPPKASDNRRFDDTKTVQCEAISPPDLADIVEVAILERTDIDAYNDALEWQREIREAA